MKDSFKNHHLNIFLVLVFNFNLNRHFLPFWRADLTASASLQGIRSEGPRLHAPAPRICSNLDS